jgi:hypothetical protein
MTSKKIYQLSDFAAGVYLSEAPSPPMFLFGVVLQFRQNMVSNRTQHPPPPPSHTLSVYAVL